MTRLQEIKAMLETDSYIDPSKKWRDQATTDISWLLDQLEQALEVLKEVEWAGISSATGKPYCLVCGNLEPKHHCTCKLAELIERLEG